MNDNQMDYSVLRLENGVHMYMRHPEPKPNVIGVEGTREFLHWQNKLEIYTIKPEDVDAFSEFLTDSRVSGQDGMPVSPLLVELFKDNSGQVFARRKAGVSIDGKGDVLSVGATCEVCQSEYSIAMSNPLNPVGLRGLLCDECRVALKLLIEGKREQLGVMPTSGGN